MKNAKEYADEFYQMIWNNYDSSKDLTEMFMEYGKQCAREALKDAANSAISIYSDTGGLSTDRYSLVDKDSILSIEIKTP